VTKSSRWCAPRADGYGSRILCLFSGNRVRLASPSLPSRAFQAFACATSSGCEEKRSTTDTRDCSSRVGQGRRISRACIRIRRPLELLHHPGLAPFLWYSMSALDKDCQVLDARSSPLVLPSSRALLLWAGLLDSLQFTTKGHSHHSEQGGSCIISRLPGHLLPRTGSWTLCSSQRPLPGLSEAIQVSEEGEDRQTRHAAGQLLDFVVGSLLPGCAGLGG
jgi:hypothetical protein